MASAVLKIEKNVPIAPRIGGPGATAKYPFKEMEVGDSFVALLSDSRSPDMTKLRTSIWQSAKAAIGTGKIATRKLPDGSGFRVWRIA